MYSLSSSPNIHFPFPLVTGTSSDSSLSAALVGGVAGGVGGSLLLVIIVLVVIVGVLVCQVRRRGHAKFNVSGK